VPDTEDVAMTVFGVATGFVMPVFDELDCDTPSHSHAVTAGNDRIRNAAMPGQAIRCIGVFPDEPEIPATGLNLIRHQRSRVMHHTGQVTQSQTAGSVTIPQPRGAA